MKLFRNSVAKNMLCIFLYQLVSLAFGIFVPQLILLSYGSQLHGVTSTVTNIMQYVLLINAGIVNIAMHALYRAFAEKDTKRINEVVNSAYSINIRMGIVSSGIILVLSVVFSLFVSKEGISFYTILFISFVMGLQQVLERFLICTYQIIIQADQKMYVVYLVNILSCSIRGIAQILLIKLNFSLVIVQAMPAAVLLISWVCFRFYVRKKYPYLDKSIAADKSIFKTRGHALIHNLAGLIVNNSAVLLLTVFCNQIAVSIYAVYNLVVAHLHSVILTVFSKSSLTSFGKVYAMGNMNDLRNKHSNMELLFNMIVAVAYSVCYPLFCPFVYLYTSGQSEVDYINPILATFFVLFGILNGLREPGIMMIDAIAQYKETKRGAMIEVLINVTFAFIGTIIWGLSGVLLGLVIAFIFRYIDVSIYINKKVLRQSFLRTFRRGLQSVLIIFAVYMLTHNLIEMVATSWLAWLLSAVILSIISVMIVFVVFGLTDKKQVVGWIMKLLTKLRRGKR